jgi:hypothetical protein
VPLFLFLSGSLALGVPLRAVTNSGYRSARKTCSGVCAPLTFSIGRWGAHVLGWDGASEEEGQKVGGTGWSADIERRASVGVGRRALAVIEERLLTGIRADDLIAHWARRVLLGDRTGADGLIFRQGLIETRK